MGSINAMKKIKLTAILVDIGSHAGDDSCAFVAAANSTRSGADGSSLFEGKTRVAARLASLVRDGVGLAFIVKSLEQFCFWPFRATRCSIAEETRNTRREPGSHRMFSSTLLSQSQGERGWSGLNLAMASAKKDSVPKSLGGIAQQSQIENPVLTALRDPV